MVIIHPRLRSLVPFNKEEERFEELSSPFLNKGSVRWMSFPLNGKSTQIQSLDNFCNNKEDDSDIFLQLGAF